MGKSEHTGKEKADKDLMKKRGFVFKDKISFPSFQGSKHYLKKKNGKRILPTKNLILDIYHSKK